MGLHRPDPLQGRSGLSCPAGHWPGFSLALLALLGTAAATMADPPDRGRYLFRLAGCAGCHTAKDGAPLAGGRAIETVFGTFYTPNITPHPEQGIGSWSLGDFMAAMRDGRAPDGRFYFPVFPYPAYSLLRDQDLKALWRYLKSLPSVARVNRSHQAHWLLRRSPAVRVWRLVNFSPGAYQDDPERSAQWNRGAYIARALAHCGECHTPRDKLGAPIQHLYLAGGLVGAEKRRAPNITPHRDSGIGKWSRDDLWYFLESGGLPDGDYTGGLMAEVVDEGLRWLTETDREALAEYLRGVPPLPSATPRKVAAKKAREAFE